MIKNTAAQSIGAQLVNASDGTAFTGAVTIYVTLDNGVQAIGTVGGGACTHEGNGYHTYAPSQAETNGNLNAYTFIGTGAVPQTVQVYTRAASPVVTVEAMNASVITAASIAADAITGAKVAADVTIASVTDAVGSVTGNVGGNVVGSIGSVAAAGIAASSLAAAAKQDIADYVLDRNMATGTDSGTDSTAVRTTRQALRVLRNKTGIAVGVATITKEDDITASWTAAVTTAAGNPISEVNPT